METEALADLPPTAQGEPLLAPKDLRARHPLSLEARLTVERASLSARRIIRGEDKRLLAIVGPCSIHDPGEAVEFARLLAGLLPRLDDQLVVVMRAYLEKPRTALGWRGFAIDPRMDGSCAIGEGLSLSRACLAEILSLGLPVAGELLDPFLAPYFDDAYSWMAVGARTAESQTHRELASGLAIPVGFKNATDGDIMVAINAMHAAAGPHAYPGLDAGGRARVIRTGGNPYCHLVLRGGKASPNHFEEDIATAQRVLLAEGLPPAVIVDCSHGNSYKRPERQALVLHSLVDQIAAGRTLRLRGFMLESNLLPGRQDPVGSGAPLEKGVSVTDPCLGWEDTEKLLLETADRLRTLEASRIRRSSPADGIPSRGPSGA